MGGSTRNEHGGQRKGKNVRGSKGKKGMKEDRNRCAMNRPAPVTGSVCVASVIQQAQYTRSNRIRNFLPHTLLYTNNRYFTSRIWEK